MKNENKQQCEICLDMVVDRRHRIKFCEGGKLITRCLNCKKITERDVHNIRSKKETKTPQ